ncbi:hypothetical protein [Paraburkholderia sp. C35]|uniref:hypothetical protein n=1 Tax=Paraburkholderia sp. C35 TaxID=2126993 RepID=UPI000D688543|nr:hypothetical protein [Paraburkholderia sp. C35]
MDNDRKPLVTSREPADMASGEQAEQESAEQPLDERAESKPAASGTAEAPGRRSKRSKRSPDVTRPLSIVRLQTKPKQLESVKPGGAPDWSLRPGVATVLFGFVIAFGTYAIVTERDSVQSHLRHFVEPDKSTKLAKQDVPPLPVPPPADVAEAPRPPVEAPQIPIAARDNATPGTPASSTVSASAALAQNAPPSAPSVSSLSAPSPVTSVAAAPAAQPAPSAPPVTRRDTLAARPNPIEKRPVASTTPPAVREAPKATAQAPATNTAPTRTASAAQKDRRTNPKTACGPLKACDESLAREERVPRDPITARAPVKTLPAPVIREAAVTFPAASPGQLAPPPVQVEAKAEPPASASLSVNKDLFRAH